MPIILLFPSSSFPLFCLSSNDIVRDLEIKNYFLFFYIYPFNIYFSLLAKRCSRQSVGYQEGGSIRLGAQSPFGSISRETACQRWSESNRPTIQQESVSNAGELMTYGEGLNCSGLV